ncbi:MAG: hypothetical protein ABW352_12225 [Polyangiales bacterium]
MSLLVLNLALGAGACEVSTGEEDSDRTGDIRTPGDAGRVTTVAPDASNTAAVGNDAGGASDAASADAGGSGDGGSTTPPAAVGSTSQAPEQCALPLPTASAACAGPDVFEPNDTKESAIDVTAASGCARVPGKLSSDREYDFYQIITPRSDPVRVELAYETTASNGVDLGFRVYTPTEVNSIASNDGRREDVTWTISDTFQSKKNFAYQVEVYDNGNLSGCQGYNLRVDPQFCTDPYEDNDSQSALAKGLAYGTPLSATVFPYDEDWYDTSALAAGGASCVITSDLKAGSVSRLSVSTYGTGSVNSLLDRTLDGNQPSVTIEVQAGVGTTALKVSASDYECTKYTVTCTPL